MFPPLAILCFICMAPIYFLQKLHEKRIGTGYTELAIGVRRAKDLQLAIPPCEIFEILPEKLCRLKSVGRLEYEKNEGFIFIRTKPTIRSLGEDVRIDITEIDSNSSKVHISSQPLISTTLFDFGKNGENLRILSTAIREAEKSYLEKDLLI